MMIPSTAKVPDFATIPVMDNVPSLDSQVEAPTAATNVAHEMQHDSFKLSALQNRASTIATNVVCDARHGVPKSSGEPKSDFR